MAQPRSVRVATAPIPVRIADASGRLMNVSATGALVQLNRTLQAEEEWPLLLSVESKPVELRARVIRSATVSKQVPGVPWQRLEYAVALAFTGLSSMAREALHKLCGDAFGEQE